MELAGPDAEAVERCLEQADGGRRCLRAEADERVERATARTEGQLLAAPAVARRSRTDGAGKRAVAVGSDRGSARRAPRAARAVRRGRRGVAVPRAGSRRSPPEGRRWGNSRRRGRDVARRGAPGGDRSHTSRPARARAGPRPERGRVAGSSLRRPRGCRTCPGRARPAPGGARLRRARRGDTRRPCPRRGYGAAASPGPSYATLVR